MNDEVYLNNEVVVINNIFEKKLFIYNRIKGLEYEINEDTFNILCDIKNKVYKFYDLKKKYGKDFLNQLLDLEILTFKPQCSSVNIKIPAQQNNVRIFAEVTDKCNLKCKHCYGSFDCNNNNILNIADLKKLIDNAALNGVYQFDLTGGEPFLYPDIEELLQYLFNSGMLVRIFTNLTVFTEKQLKMVLKYGVKNIITSIDSSVEKIHDEFRGQNGCFNKTVNSIKLLKENNIDVTINTMIGNHNMGHIEDITDKEYDAYEMFQNVITLVEYKFEEKGIKLNVKIAPDLPQKLIGDKSNITKAIMNLLTNAVKYTSEGYVNLDINCINKSDVSTLMISVEDTGRGIKPEQLDKLFVRFSRLEEDRNTTTEGTGLGLAITKHILELMGGKVTVQSVYGRGSKFTITLNQKIVNTNYYQNNDNNLKLPSVDSNNKTNNQSESEENISNFSGKKILIIDDNVVNLKVATRLLQKFNCETEEVSSGQACIDKINNGGKYDLLLMDEMMPNMSGTETMKKLKEREYTIPIVVLTADVEANSREKFISSGFNEYLGKPTSLNELERILIKFFK